MLHLFVSPAPFEGWGDCPYDGTTLSQLLAVLIVIVSVGALALTVCLSLVIIGWRKRSRRWNGFSPNALGGWLRADHGGLTVLSYVGPAALVLALAWGVVKLTRMAVGTPPSRRPQDAGIALAPKQSVSELRVDR